MEAITNFLSGIGDAIVKAWEFVLAFFRDFMQFLELLTKMPVILADVQDLEKPRRALSNHIANSRENL